MTHCRKKSKCAYCPEVITAGEPMVVGKLWREGPNARRWTIMLRWHPQCWLDQGFASLEKRPYVPRKSMMFASLTDEQKKKRLSILRRRAAVLQRIRWEMMKPDAKRNIGVIIRLGGLLDKQKNEIESLGGVPKSWG